MDEHGRLEDAIAVRDLERWPDAEERLRAVVEFHRLWRLVPAEERAGALAYFRLMVARQRIDDGTAAVDN